MNLLQLCEGLAMAEQEQYRLQGKSTQLVIVDPEIEGRTVGELLESIIQESEEGIDSLAEVQKPLLERLTPSLESTVLPYLTREPDRAVIEASLAPHTRWTEHSSGFLSYLSSHGIEVSVMSTPGRPLDIPAAREEIKKLGDSSVLVARTLLLLIHTRTREGLVGKNGMVPVLIAELLERMGIQKHYKPERAYADAPVIKKYTDGYRSENKKRIIRDVAMLTTLFVRAAHIRDGLPTGLATRSSYLHADIITVERNGTDVIAGFWINLGAWVNFYEPSPADPTDQAFARIEEAIGRLNAKTQQHAFRIALNLIEQWRDAVALLRTPQQHRLSVWDVFAKPVVMSDLLSTSMIPIDNDHIADRQAPRIEAALSLLQERDKKTNLPIVGSAQPVVPVDYQSSQWGPIWKKTEWIILPPDDLIKACSSGMRRPQSLLDAPKVKRGERRRHEKQSQSNT